MKDLEDLWIPPKLTDTVSMSKDGEELVIPNGIAEPRKGNTQMRELQTPPKSKRLIPKPITKTVTMILSSTKEPESRKLTPIGEST